MDISINDLLPRCHRCDGTGRMEKPQNDEQQDVASQAHKAGVKVTCNLCNGHGVVPTKSGRALLEFIRLAKRKSLL